MGVFGIASPFKTTTFVTSYHMVLTDTVTNKLISTVIGKKQVAIAITSYTEARPLKKDSQTGIHLHNRI